jgi:polysaccharide biosynthesis/export protein
MFNALNLHKKYWKGSVKACEQFGRWSHFVSPMLITLLAGTLITGCHTPQSASNDETENTSNSEEIVLAEGDSLRVSFPGAPNLNAPAQHIRRDGIISLPLIGDFKAAGLRPTELEKELVKLYGSQLQTKEVKVEVDSATLSVYVTGAVLRPGKINSERSINALEAIM